MRKPPGLKLIGSRPGTNSALTGLRTAHVLAGGSDSMQLLISIFIQIALTCRCQQRLGMPCDGGLSPNSLWQSLKCIECPLYRSKTRCRSSSSARFRAPSLHTTACTGLIVRANQHGPGQDTRGTERGRNTRRGTTLIINREYSGRIFWPTSFIALLCWQQRREVGKIPKPFSFTTRKLLLL
ncbi:hypothetical protein AOQ84DRAFT_95742 [Glonium stellatum]|uniref:Uncharacterized protein n=1 Tax=Glonium stellatum TaxID=574774 RepID=A0A8E2EV84_9PEZI|nr:hypothetical protein AOQ84DRAFT_95742 [Glonium stellatum]